MIRILLFKALYLGPLWTFRNVAGLRVQSGTVDSIGLKTQGQIAYWNSLVGFVGCRAKRGPYCSILRGSRKDSKPKSAAQSVLVFRVWGLWRL